MKKVAFYIDNKSVADIDLTNLVDGNPGIGGTEYLIMLVSTLLSKRNNDIEVKVWMTRKQKTPDGLNISIVSNLSDAIIQAEHEDFECFILKHDADNIIRDVLRTNGNLKFYVWCHVFVCYWELDYYSRNPFVQKIVYVGREMYDLYRDHPSFKKSTYIYNCVNFLDCKSEAIDSPFFDRDKIVTYVGSLVPYKGFHKLAEIWPVIVKAVPEAQLCVIGSGNLYNSASELGKYGFAEKAYEEYFMKYFTDENGDIFPNVHFLGKLGVEKKDVLLKTKVGVPNPTGISETFCLSAVEMQACGARIATLVSPGYLDTIKNGVLCKNPNDLANTIIYLLNSSSSSYMDAMNYFEKEFSVDVVLAKWELLIRGELLNNKTKNWGYRMKWLKEILRLLYMIIPLNKILPPLERLLLFRDRNLFKKTTYMDSNIKW